MIKRVGLIILLLASWLLTACAEQPNPPTSPSLPPITSSPPSGSPNIGTPLAPPFSPDTTLTVPPNFMPPPPNPSEAIGPTAAPPIINGRPVTLPPTLAVPNNAIPSAEPLAKDALIIATDSGLFALSPDGKTSRPILTNARFADPQLSPDRARIATLRTDPLTRRQALYILKIGEAGKAISDEGGAVLEAAWSPDGKQLALVRVTDTNGDGAANAFDTPDLWLYNLADGSQKKLTSGGQNPAWSPDGNTLAYIVSSGFAKEIDPATRLPRRNPNSLERYDLKANTKRNLLTANSASIDQYKLRYFKGVAWSPDGKTLAASADGLNGEGKPTGLVLGVDPTSGKPNLLANAGKAAGRLSWGATGLAFETMPQYPLAVADFAGIALKPSDGPLVLLGQSAGNHSEVRAPRWLPNAQLAYIEGYSSILTLYDPPTKTTTRLISGCNGIA